MAINIKQTLEDNISSKKVLNLAAGLFPGIIQTAINYYLNGVTIPIGEDVSLTVKGGSADLKLEMQPVSLNAEASKDEATVTIKGTGEYADASITVTFKKVSDTDVSITLAAGMGNSLVWKLSDLWPELLDNAPFNEVGFTRGHLTLSVSTADEIDFFGNGTLSYKGDDLATGVVKIIYDGKTTAAPDPTKVSVLTGAVVNSWSPGTIWKPLDDVVFKESGLLFSSLPSTNSSTLTDLGLFVGDHVPSVVNGDFTVPAGISFFTTLELKKFLAPLTNVIGADATLALFANSDLSKKLQIIAKFTGGTFRPKPKAIFEFEGFDVEWDLDLGTSYALTASANGKFFPPDGSTGGIGLSLSSTIKPSEGDIDFKLAIDDWNHPFGYQKLIIKELAAIFTAGASAEGITIGLSGDFDFTPDDGHSFEFGVAGEIADFEVPTGVAFLLKSDSPGQTISIGDLINGITSLDTSKIPGIDVINEILQIQNVDFAVVEGPSLTIGDKTFKKGFTADADFDILEQEEVIIDVNITGGPGSEQFDGLAELKEAVKFGKVFTLEAYDHDNKKPDPSKGPIFAVSSAGKTFQGINDGNPVYFYADGYMELLDIIQADLYGIATKDGLFEFIADVEEHAQFGNVGQWGGRSIAVGLNPQEYQFNAAFDFNFGWKNVSIGPLKIFDVDLIPKINFPDFAISAGLGIDVDGKALTFELLGEFTFDFLGLDINYGGPNDLKTIFKIDLKGAITKLSDVAAKIWDWLLANIVDLLKAAWTDLEKFVSWIGKNLSKLGLSIVNVAKAIWNGFTKSISDLVSALKQLAYSASEIFDALVHSLGLDFAEVTEAIDELFAKGGCSVVSGAPKS